MYTEMMSIAMPIFKDRTVITLMALVRLFASENDESIKRMRNRFYTLLEGYVQETTKNDVGFDMQHVNKCFDILPKLFKIFKDM